MRKILTLLTVFMLCGVLAFAQEKSITGNVINADGTPLPRITVQVQGTKTATLTDDGGDFSIKVPNNATLLFSGVGLASQSLKVGNKLNYNIVMQSEAQVLEQVVVTGYSTSTKEAFTGSAKVVSGEQLNKKEVSNVSQALAGEVAGVRVINTSGQPGTSATIRIRGIGSVNGNRSPLYVVDGVAYSGSLNALNTSDIASITVLKDAAATAIYGVDGSNGVIVITTNSGTSGKSFIDVDAKFGTNKSIIPRYDVLTSPEEYIGLSWEGLYNQGVKLGVVKVPDPVKYANDNLFSGVGISPNNNMWDVANGGDLIDATTRSVKPGVKRKFNPEKWEDYAFQPSNRSEVNVKMGGGNSKTNYYSSLGYLKSTGYSINSDFQRFSARLSLDHEVKSWLKTDFNFGYANTTTNNNGQESTSNSVFWFVDNIPPIYPLFKRDANGDKIADPFFGGYQYDYGTNGRKFGSLTNSIADANYNTLLTKQNNLSGNASITINFTKDLSLQNRLGIQYFNQDYWELTNKFYGSAAGQNGNIWQSKSELLNQNLLNMLKYSHRFNEHGIEVLAAHEATDYKLINSSASGYNLVSNYSLELANAIVINPTSSSYANTNKLESYFGQVNYDYNRTYYLSATVRRDGSSRFIKGNAWGTFGAIGAAWELTRMSFMNTQKTFNYLKLKASYGVIGDQSGLGYYPGFNRINIGNLNDNPSFGVQVPGNADLTWETSKMAQVGVEFRLGSYLTGAIDYYVKNTDNLIFDRRIGPSNGYALITVNDGRLRNQGIEFDLTGHIIKKKDFYLDIGVNGEHFTNEITAMPMDPSTGKQKVIDPQGAYGWSKGHSIYDFYIRNFEGVDPDDGTSTWTVYYHDDNGNGEFDYSSDPDKNEGVTDLEDYYGKNPDQKGKLMTGITKTYSRATVHYAGKSALPKVRGAFNLNSGFKGINLSVQLLYSFGGYAYDGAYAVLMNNDLVGGNNWHTDIRKRWQKKGDITDVPRISNNADANVTSASSRFITEASYLVLNNVRLSYTFPESLMGRQNIVEKVTFFVSGDNLWLHSARDGFNPSTAESGSSDMYRYSPLSTITVGLNARF